MNELNEALKTYREKGFVVAINMEDSTLVKMAATVVLAVILSSVAFFVIKRLFQ